MIFIYKVNIIKYQDINIKSIELKEEHKSKLLEMCKELFPEYPNLQFGVKEKHNWSKDYLVFGLIGDEPIIHWFEFCMRYLLPKVFNKKRIKLDCTFGEESDLIEIIYKQFKKMKK